MFMDMASSVTSAIGSQIADAVKGQDGESRIETVAKFLEPAILFRVHPALGIIDVVAQQFGFSLSGTIKQMFQYFIPQIRAGLSEEQINQAAQPFIQLASKSELRMIKLAVLQSTAYYGQTKGTLFGDRSPGGAFALPDKGTSIWNRIFGFLGPGKTRNFIGGFAMWLIKTTLLSAGLLAGGAAIAGLVGSIAPAKPQEPTMPEVSPETAPPQQQYPLASTTAPQRQQSQRIWYVPIQGSVVDTLIDWAVELKPELAGYEDLFMKSRKFNTTVFNLRQNIDPRTPKFIIMPQIFRDKEDVVSTFIHDVLTLKHKESNATH